MLRIKIKQGRGLGSMERGYDFRQVVKKGFTEVATFEQRFEDMRMSRTINGGRAP